MARKPKPCKSEPEVCHRKIDSEVCPRCGSDATSAVVMDEVEGTVCCSTCGIHYEVVREAALKYVYWTDDDGEHFVFDDEYLVRAAAVDLRAVAQEFVNDVEAVGLPQVAREWPDLVVTYHKARLALSKAAGERRSP